MFVWYVNKGWFHWMYSRYIHGSGFPCAVVAQEGSDLTLVEGDAQPIYSRPGAAVEHLIQVLHTHT